MYLYKHKFVNSHNFDKKPSDAKRMKIEVTNEYEDGSEETVTYDVTNPRFGALLKIPFIYWRKANQIHKFFIDNCANGVDEGQDVYVDGEMLKTLYEKCKQVLEDNSKAHTLLPTQEGFFFGSTEYDEYYYKTLQQTVEELENCDFDDNYIYEASW